MLVGLYFFTIDEFFKENEKWEEALKEIYIDMALQTNDKEWFMELTSKEGG